MNKLYLRSAKIRVFIDYWNLANNWNSFHGSFPDKNLDWAALPKAIIDALDEIPQLRNMGKDLRGIKVYASSIPISLSKSLNFDETQRIQEDSRLNDWLQN